MNWWTKTINPGIGCNHVSEACENCWAALTAWKLAHNPKLNGLYEGLTRKTAGGKIQWTGEVKEVPQRLHQPKHWKKPQDIFWGDMTDLFHDQFSFEYLDRIIEVQQATPWHVHMMLTKRTGRALDYFNYRKEKGLDQDYSMIYLGATVENNREAENRIPNLLKIPVAVRFLSCEPLFGHLALDCIEIETLSEGVKVFNAWTGEYIYPDSDLPSGKVGKIDWVITGGESGKEARPTHPDHFRSLRDNCIKYGVPFFFKQWGEWLPASQMPDDECRDWLHTLKSKEIQTPQNWPDTVFKIGKNAAGQTLDGIEWTQKPERREVAV